MIYYYLIDNFEFISSLTITINKEVPKSICNKWFLLHVIKEKLIKDKNALIVLRCDGLSPEPCEGHLVVAVWLGYPIQVPKTPV